ncbi:MAG: bifunctional precorrin-2 dehydrogenase/sirohydrochlorin ferrochelatase [Dysgonamonadaceae bacterium]|jgi:siroheme synthase-like protein|nr:bifunctional precorrin-2 dehydrogenase/sirohydrochlorin ferrochelatase [Dysgonamonadaceae bacterium]
MYLPIAINITDKKILIIGGGKTGYHKAAVLSRFTAEATVVSPRFHSGFRDLPFTLVEKEYAKEDLDGVALVYICTENEQLNRQIKQDAAERGILACVCDNPSLCDFISPAIFRQDGICIAVSSGARDVRRSIAVRNRIAAMVENGTLETGR